MLSVLSRALAPRTTVHAHCDIPCGVYDPAQARIEAESCYKIIQKYLDSSDELFRARCVHVKEERAEDRFLSRQVVWDRALYAHAFRNYRQCQAHASLTLPARPIPAPHRVGPCAVDVVRRRARRLWRRPRRRWLRGGRRVQGRPHLRGWRVRRPRNAAGRFVQWRRRVGWFTLRQLQS